MPSPFEIQDDTGEKHQIAQHSPAMWQLKLKDAVDRAIRQQWAKESGLAKGEDKAAIWTEPIKLQANRDIFLPKP